MSHAASSRKCTMCGQLARQVTTEEEINESFDHDTGIFQTCLFDNCWEICKDVEGAGDQNDYIYYKNGNCVGRFRELN